MSKDSRADRLALEFTPAQVEGDAVVALAGQMGRTPQDGDAVLRLAGKVGSLDRSPKDDSVT